MHWKWNFMCGIAKNVTEGLQWIDFYQKYVNMSDTVHSKTSAASPTLVLMVIRVFWRIPSWITSRAKPSSSTFLLCFFRSWRISFNLPKESRSLHFPCFFACFFVFLSMNSFTSASCVEKRVGIVGNGYTLGPLTYLSSLRSNLDLAGSGIHGRRNLMLKFKLLCSLAERLNFKLQSLFTFSFIKDLLLCSLAECQS